MSQIPTFILILTCLTQQADPATPAASAPSGSAAPAESAQPAKTEAEKVVDQAIEKLDTIEYISAKIRQTIRAAGDEIVSTGTYRVGPNYRSLFEIDVDLGKDVKAKRVQASDGKTALVYEDLLGTEKMVTFQVSEVMPLFEQREIPPESKRQFLQQLPFVRPADMLRGYLETILFDKVSDETLDGRPVYLVEGKWRDSVVPVIAQDGNIQKPEDLRGETPQYARLYIDKATGFPLKIELYRKDEKAEYKPIMTLEFLDVNNNKIPDSDFTFVPPEKCETIDATVQFVAQLKGFPERAEKPATAKPGTQAVGQPLVPKGK